MEGHLTPAEYSKREKISRQRVSFLLSSGRFSTAIRVLENGYYRWFIPCNAKPRAAKNGRPRKDI